jgi:hypothetical protein
MRFERTLGVLGLSWLGLLGVVKSLPAQNTSGAPPFRVIRFGRYLAKSGGLLTITGGTVRFDSGEEDSFEVPIGGIVKVNANKPNGCPRFVLGVGIKLSNGKSYCFVVPSEKHALFDGKGWYWAPVEPLVEALTAAMTEDTDPLRPPTQTPAAPRRTFAPIQAPPAPLDALAAHVSIVVGQTPDQVKSTLGSPDRIDSPPSSAGASNKIMWFYKSLTVTFVEGKVSVVEQERP